MGHFRFAGKMTGMLVLGLVFSGVIGCRGGGSSSDTSTGATSEPAPIPIPPDSPLAKVQEGWSTKHVIDVLGQPTDQGSYMTGKSFNPFYFGGDSARVIFRYKGMGRVIFTRNHMMADEFVVMSVEYDPAEKGYNE